ncbi:hypothetical protein FQA39_LY06112 [Lamprigera yunnana]|nr:hypothetical protein FQA39_LY06112 [Lamprigera yunnana]
MKLVLEKLDNAITAFRDNLKKGSIELYEPPLSAIGKPLLINFVLKACLLHRDNIQKKSNYTNTNGLITALVAQLQQTKQGNLIIDKYERSTESLMGDLTIAQAGDNREAIATFREANEKIAIDVFTKGIRNRKVWTVTGARNFKFLSKRSKRRLRYQLNVYSNNNSILKF